jgi:hypothetical protein
MDYDKKLKRIDRFLKNSQGLKKSKNYEDELDKLNKSRSYWKKKVDATAKQKMGSAAWDLMKKKEKQKQEQAQEQKSKAAVIYNLDMQIEKTKPDSAEERELMKRRERLIKAMRL